MTEAEPESPDWAEESKLVNAIAAFDTHPNGLMARANLDIMLANRQVKAMKGLESEIKRFNRSSTWLAGAMIILAAAQLIVAVLAWIS